MKKIKFSRYVTLIIALFGASTMSFNCVAQEVADRFQSPVCPPSATDDRDGDGCYIALDFRESNHLGEDWNGERGGDTDLFDPVYAIGNGVVISAQNEGPTWGNVVRVSHSLTNGESIVSLYGHLDEINVGKFQIVERGDTIGTIGRGYFYGIDEEGVSVYDYDENSACCSHLHFEIRSDEELPIGPGYSSNAAGYEDPTEYTQELNDLPPPLNLVSCDAPIRRIVDTASGDYISNGGFVGDTIWRFHDFALDEPSRIRRIGACVENYTRSGGLQEPAELFVIIAQVSDVLRRPNNVDFSDVSIVASGILEIPPVSLTGGVSVIALYEASVNAILEPGRYVIAIGSGAFGADSLGDTILALRSLERDLAPFQFPQTAFQLDFWNENAGTFGLSNLNLKFVVD